jgi:hypothetical protein
VINSKSRVLFLSMQDAIRMRLILKRHFKPNLLGRRRWRRGDKIKNIIKTGFGRPDGHVIFIFNETIHIHGFRQIGKRFLRTLFEFRNLTVI